MQVSCQVGKHEGCASLPPPPNSLELFTLFSLPFLHFYNFLGTQVEWGGGRSLVLSGPCPVCCWLRISVGTRLLFSFFSSSQEASLPRPPAESGIRVFFLLGRVYKVRQKPLNRLVLPHAVPILVGTSVHSTQSHTLVYAILISRARLE